MYSDGTTSSNGVQCMEVEVVHYSRVYENVWRSEKMRTTNCSVRVARNESRGCADSEKESKKGVRRNGNGDNAMKITKDGAWKRTCP